MTLVEYIKNHYDVTEKIRNRVRNPAETIYDTDALPCDAEEWVDGVKHKIVYIDDDMNYVTVLALMSLQESEIESFNNPNLTETWRTYMSFIDTSDMEMQELLTQAKLFNAKKDAKREVIQHLLHNQKFKEDTSS